MVSIFHTGHHYMAERRSCKAVVGGSNPLAGLEIETNSANLISLVINNTTEPVAVAQLARALGCDPRD